MDNTNSNLPPVNVDVDEKSSDAISHKPFVKLYATRVFQESTMGVLSSIFTTQSKHRKIFKVFLSLLCISGFIYHCITFLNHVLGYPEVIDIYKDSSIYYNWPAYTYCENNPVRRSVFCSEFPNYCVKASDEFCNKYRSYCGANDTLIPKEEYYYLLPENVQAHWILKYGGVPNILNMDTSFIRINAYNTVNYTELERRKRKEGTVEISGQHLRSASSPGTLKTCYSIHSLVENNQLPLQKRRVEMDGINEVISFYLNETEMMNPRKEPGLYFSVHSPFEAANPLQKGIFMKGGKVYDLYVEMQQEVLLEAPFESNCLDYEELWGKNNRTGLRSTMMCRQKCFFDWWMLMDGCGPFFTLYPNKEWICGDEITSNFTTTRLLLSENEAIDFFDVCMDNCRDECRLSKYTTEVSIQDDLTEVKEEERHRHVKVRVHLSNERVKVLRHSPKYETVDVISAIGGFMGCWLGIALMDILDAFGNIITVCSYRFRKRLNKEN